MIKKYSALAIVAVVAVALFWPRAGRGESQQDDLAAFKDNACVTCHSSTALAGPVTNRYLEWHLSVHKDAGVSCEKCHGGNPAERSKAAAHLGVLPAADAKSRLHPSNVAATCGTCHSAISATFVESVHGLDLKGTSSAPTCNTCHAHMASAVARFPQEAMELCSQCHGSKPELVKRAGEAVEALERAYGIVVWGDRLIDAGQERKLSLTAEQPEMKAIHAQLDGAVIEWHRFNLDATQQKADAAFAAGAKSKDKLMKRLGFVK